MDFWDFWEDYGKTIFLTVLGIGVITIVGMIALSGLWTVLLEKFL